MKKIDVQYKLSYTLIVKKLIKNFIIIFFHIFTFNLFALSYYHYTWEKDDYSSNLCKNETSKKFYEEQLRKTFQDDSIELYAMHKANLNKFISKTIYHVFLSKFSKRHFRKIGIPIGRNSGYCILDESNQLINLWKNGKEVQKLIKAAELSKRNNSDRKEFISFIYEECMAEESMLSTVIIDSYDDLLALHINNKRVIYKYKNLKNAIKITDSYIEFYVLKGPGLPDFSKITFKFDEENGITMQETLLEEKIDLNLYTKDDTF